MSDTTTPAQADKVAELINSLEARIATLEAEAKAQRAEIDKTRPKGHKPNNPDGVPLVVANAQHRRDMSVEKAEKRDALSMAKRALEQTFDPSHFRKRRERKMARSIK